MYHRDIFDTNLPVESYWADSAPPFDSDFKELEEEVSCDVAVVGAGYSGMAAALRLAREYSCDVRVIEASLPGWGASGRNGGFCCVGGSKLSWREIIDNYGMSDARQFSDYQRASVSFVQDFARQEALEIDATESGEYQLAHREREVEALKEETEFLRAKLGHAIRFLTREELEEQGVSGPEFLAGVHNSEGFGLNPLKYARGLASSLSKAKVPLYVNSPLVSWAREANLQVLRTPSGALRAKKVILATNGFTSEHLMKPLRGRLMPALSNILVTRPLSQEELAAQGWHSRYLAYDTRQLLHYFRLLPDGCFLFGGRGGTRTDPKSLEVAKKELRQSFERMFPAWRNAETTHFWRGLVCLTYRFVPYAGPLDDEKRIWTSIAYHGSGVALASQSGARLADWIAGRSGAQEEIPAAMRAGLPRFPFPALRLLYLRSAYGIYRLKDEIF